MYDDDGFQPNDLYFQCTDIVIEGAAATGSGGEAGDSTSAEATGGSTTGAQSGSTTGTPADGDPSESGTLTGVADTGEDSDPPATETGDAGSGAAREATDDDGCRCRSAAPPLERGSSWLLLTAALLGVRRRSRVNVSRP
jgi:hypothetical protein